MRSCLFSTFSALRFLRSLISLSLLGKAGLVVGLRFLLWSEVIDNIETLAELLNRHPSDDTAELSAGQVKELFDIKEVSGKDNILNSVIIVVYEVRIPLCSNVFHVV